MVAGFEDDVAFLSRISQDVGSVWFTGTAQEPTDRSGVDNLAVRMAQSGRKATCGIGQIGFVIFRIEPP
jgi:hypothetical protein